MKRAIAIMVLALAGAADAEVIAAQANLTGGMLVITDDSARGCRNLAYSYDRSGARMYGCWVYVDHLRSVRIDWEGGNGTGFYPSQTFRLSPYGVEKYLRPGMQKQEPQL